MRESVDQPGIASGMNGKSMNVISARGRLVRNDSYLRNNDTAQKK
jgi:hypothetical protein